MPKRRAVPHPTTLPNQVTQIERVDNSMRDLVEKIKNLNTKNIGKDNKTFVPILLGGPHLIENPDVLFIGQESSGSFIIAYLIGWGPLSLLNNSDVLLEDNQPASNVNVSVLHLYTGTGNTVPSEITSIDADWDSSFPGIAWCVLRFPVASEGLPVGDPNTVKIKVAQGLKCRDSRVDLVTYSYSKNVAVCRAELWTNKRWGKGRADTNVDWGTVEEASDDCDVDLGGGRKRFELSYMIRNKKSFEQIDKEIGESAQMFTGFSAGKHQMFVDKDRAASNVVFTDDTTSALRNIVSASFKLKDKGEVYNEVSYSYTSSDNNFERELATTRNPILDATAERNLLEISSDGTPRFDQAKRLSITRLNKEILSDKIYYLDVLYHEGIRCSPGLVITVTCKEFEWTNQLAVIKNLKRTGKTFRLVLDIFDSSVYENTIQTDAYTPPVSGPDPYGTVPDVDNAAIVEVYDPIGATGKFFKVEWDRPAYQYYQKVRVTITRVSGADTEIWIFGEFTDGPIFIPVTIDSADYDIKLQVINSRNLISTGVTLNIDTFYQIDINVEPPGTFGNGYSFEPAPNRVYNIFDTSKFTASGTSVYDVTKLQDNIDNVTALKFDATVNGYLELDNGSAIELREIIIKYKTAYATTTVGSLVTPTFLLTLKYWDGASWVDVPAPVSNWTVFYVSTTELVIQIPASLGAKQKWRICNIVANTTDEISEIQFVTYNGLYPARGYRIVQLNPVDGTDLTYYDIPVEQIPTTSNGLSANGWHTYSYDENNRTNGGRYQYKIRVQTISSGGNYLSKNRQLQRNTYYAVVPGYSDYEVTGVTNHDLVPSAGSPKYIRLYGSPGGTFTLDGVDKGFHSCELIITNDTDEIGSIAAETGSAAENQFKDAVILQIGQTASFIYDETNLLWRLMFIVGEEMQSTKDLNFGNVGTFVAGTLTTPIGNMMYDQSNVTSDTLVDIVNVTGKGVLTFLSVGSSYSGATAGNRQTKIKIIVNGTVLTSFNDIAIDIPQNSITGTGLNTAAIGAIHTLINGANTELSPIPDCNGIPFKTSLQVQARRAAASGTRYVAYQFRQYN